MEENKNLNPETMQAENENLTTEEAVNAVLQDAASNPGQKPKKSWKEELDRKSVV